MAAQNSSDPGFTMNRPGSGREPWYEDLRVIGVLLIIIGVLALPLVWFNKKFTVQRKVLITIVSVVIASILFWIVSLLSAALDQRATQTSQKREALAAQLKAPF